MQLDEILKRVRQIDPRIDSGEFGTLDALYCFRLILGRRPDAGGWEYWNQQRLTLDAAVNIFQSSDEGRLRWTPAPQLIETRRNFSIYIDPADPSVGRAIQGERDYESHVSAFFTREIAGKSGTFVDVGSNIGWYLLLAHQAAPQMRLVGFEPNPANVQLSLRSLERSGLAHATVYPFALSDRDCFLSLTFVGSNGAVGMPRDGAMMVKGVVGDRLLALEERVALIKMDVEGHEGRALLGLRETLARHRPVLMTEFHPHCLRDNGQIKPEEFLAQLMSYGYTLAIINRDAKGTEIRCAGIEEVMAAWSKHNRSQGAGGELHLDLVARPR